MNEQSTLLTSHHPTLTFDPNIMSELKKLGDNIRKARRSRGIAQEALGTASCLHRTYVCDIERGTRNVSFSSLSKIARGLQMTISELTRDTGPDYQETMQPVNGSRVLLDSRPVPVE